MLTNIQLIDISSSENYKKIHLTLYNNYSEMLGAIRSNQKPQ